MITGNKNATCLQAAYSDGFDFVFAGFPRLRVLWGGVPFIRIVVYWDLYWVPPFWETTIYKCDANLWRNFHLGSLLFGSELVLGRFRPMFFLDLFMQGEIS